MNEQEIQQLAMALVGAAMLGDLKAQQLAQLILVMAQAILSAMELALSLQLPLMQSAKAGAKLNYIKHLSGNCPKGTEMQYFKVGGKVCKRCVAKAQEGVNLEKEDTVEQFKKGRKVKCHQPGGPVEEKKDNTRVNFVHHSAIQRPGTPPKGIGHITGLGWDNQGNYMVRKPKTKPKKLVLGESDPSAGAPTYDPRFRK